MSFVLSTRSLKNLEGVKPELVSVVKRAITYTKVDFVVIEGLRTIERQRILVAQGKSQTLNSKHITGDAVDVAAFVNGDITWNASVYDEIADGFAKAARELRVSVRWGAAWTVNNIATWSGTMESASLAYIDERRRQGRRPFMDYPHFELS